MTIKHNEWLAIYGRLDTVLNFFQEISIVDVIRCINLDHKYWLSQTIR